MRTGNWRSISKWVWNRQPQWVSAVLVAEVSGLGQGGQGLDHAAIDGGQHLADVLLADAAGGRGLGPELGDDRLEPLRLEDLDGFGQRSQGGPRAADLAADLLEEAGLLQGAEGAEDRVEEEQEDQGEIVVEMELAVAGLVALAADVMEPVEERQQLVEVLEPLEVTSGDRAVVGGSVASRAEIGFVGLTV